MHSRIHRASLLAVLGGLLAGTGEGRATQSHTLDDVLRRMTRASRELTTLRAELVQQKSYPQLGIDDPPERGTLILKRASSRLRLRLEMEQPDPRTVVVDRTRYVYYLPRLKQAYLGELGTLGAAGGAGFLRYLLGDVEQDRDYRVALGAPAGDGTVHLTLDPVDPEQVFYQRVELFVDTTLWLPVRQVLVEPNRSVTRVRLEALTTGLSLADELFELELPPDVRRLRDGRP